MDYKEACGWLAGERSMVNSVPQDPIDTWDERIARADAAMMEQAHWCVTGNSIRSEVAGLRAEIARLRAENERLRAVLTDAHGVICNQEDQLRRLVDCEDIACEGVILDIRAILPNT